jgi:hypothetical protein
MKIIGESQDGFILQASKSEVANIVGHYSNYSEGFKANVGVEIQIAAMYQNLKELANSKQALEEAGKVLHRLADSLKIVEPIIEEVTNNSTPQQ